MRALRIDEPRPDAEEEPRFDVPKSLAISRGSTKQVQPGPGYRYYKRRMVPQYIDTLESPYARFVFKYRTRDQLPNEIGIEVDVEPSGDQEIRDLQDLDKQALIEMLIRAKSALGGRVPSPPPVAVMPVSGSYLDVPKAVDAPKVPYLKYSLPPSRPSGLSKPRTTGVGSQASGKAGDAEKENFRTSVQNNSSSGDVVGSTSNEWGNNASNGNHLDAAAGGNGGGWDGSAASSLVQQNSPQRRQLSRGPSTAESRQVSQASGSAASKKGAYGGKWDLPEGDVPVPPPPDQSNAWDVQTSNAQAANNTTW